jgi:hypothetical protein
LTELFFRVFLGAAVATSCTYFAGRLIFPEARENSGLANAAASCKAGKFKIGHQLRLVLSKPPPACPAHSRFLFLS